MDTGTTDKYKILEFAEGHPYVLLVVILILLIFIVATSFSGSNPLTGVCKRKKKNASPVEDDEIEELIESIHSKQKASPK